MLRINPLLAKELRIRMRTWRTFALVSLFLLGLGGFALLFFSAQYMTVRSGFGNLSNVGQSMFAFLSVFQFILVAFTVPALAGNSVSGERERQTFDLLACTQLTPLGIVTGKLTSALSAVILLLVASLPLYGFVFLMGGVSPGELFTLYGILLLTALFAGCWSLMFSALLKRSIASIVASYALTLFLTGGIFVLFMILAQVMFALQMQGPIYIPLFFTPISMYEWLYPDLVEELLTIMPNYSLDTGWLGVISLLVNIVIAGFCLWIAARAVNPLRTGKRRG